MWAKRWLEDWWNDTGFAIRQLRQAPGFTLVAVLSLALAIGANTAIFSLIESTLLRPITLKDIDRLRLLLWREQDGGWVAPNLGYISSAFGSMYEQRVTADGGIIHTDFSPRVYQEFRRDNSVFESLFAFKELGRATLVVDGSAEAVNCFLVSGDFYRGAEVTPVIGRAIAPQDDVRTQEGSVLISYDYWTQRFARDPNVVGKPITLNGVPVTIIGVNPDYFSGIEPGANFEIWAPLSLTPAISGRPWLDDTRQWQIPMMGRLKASVSNAQAQSAMDALFQTQVDADPGMLASFLKDPAKRPRLILHSAARGVDYLTVLYGPPFMALFGLAGLVLLIACANVANLLLAKSAVRQREISLKLALGARRGRIVRQLLSEGLLLAFMAGTTGVFLGFWTRNGIPALLATPWRPSLFDAAFDPKVLLVSIAMTLLTGLLFSLAPMWQSRRVEVNEALKAGSRGSASLSKLRIGRLLVVLQLAVSVLLLVGAWLCVKTFVNLRNIPLGFEPDRVLVFAIDPPLVRYPADRFGALLAELQQRLSAIPGVSSATFSNVGGLANEMRGGGRIELVDGRPIQPQFASGGSVGSRFFETMGIPILNGRAIDEHDRMNAMPAAVVNREFARRFLADANPVGRTFKASDNVVYQIVGVCGNWRSNRLRDEISPAFYAAMAQAPRSGRVNFALKISGGEASAVKPIREEVGAVDSNLAIADVRTLAEQIDNELSQERLMASLAAVFGALALILAMIGIYGLMAYTVARRTNEIGVRVALGARTGRVTWMVLRETVGLTVAGVVIGIPVALSLSPVLDHFLAQAWRTGFTFGTKPNDPLSVASALVVLIAAAVIAGYLPARRAARIDPMAALRHD